MKFMQDGARCHTAATSLCGSRTTRLTFGGSRYDLLTLWTLIQSKIYSHILEEKIKSEKNQSASEYFSIGKVTKEILEKHQPEEIIEKHQSEEIIEKHELEEILEKHEPEEIFEKHEPEEILEKHEPEEILEKHEP